MFFDIAIGLLIGLVASLISHERDVFLVAFGVFSALAPDIDFIVWLIKNGWRSNQYAHEHRDLLHKPILFSGIVGACIWIYFGPAYASIWFLGTMWHFIHDTFDGGWGIKWLYPFYQGYFTLATYSPKKHIRNLEEQRSLAGTHGNPEWLREMYSQINSNLILGTIFFIGVVGFVLWMFLFSR